MPLADFVEELSQSIVPHFEILKNERLSAATFDRKRKSDVALTPGSSKRYKSNGHLHMHKDSETPVHQVITPLQDEPGSEDFSQKVMEAESWSKKPLVSPTTSLTLVAFQRKLTPRATKAACVRELIPIQEEHRAEAETLATIFPLEHTPAQNNELSLDAQDHILIQDHTQSLDQTFLRHPDEIKIRNDTFQVKI